jgi:hypothetical protein
MEAQMSRKWIVGLGLVVALAVPVASWAHAGHAHKVMGTVSSVEGSRVSVKGTDGKVVVVVLDAKTAITRGATKVTAAELKAGERVSIDYTQTNKTNTASAVKLGTAPAAAAR